MNQDIIKNWAKKNVGLLGISPELENGEPSGNEAVLEAILTTFLKDNPLPELMNEVRAEADEFARSAKTKNREFVMQEFPLEISEPSDKVKLNAVIGFSFTAGLSAGYDFARTKL